MIFSSPQSYFLKRYHNYQTSNLAIIMLFWKIVFFGLLGSNSGKMNVGDKSPFYIQLFNVQIACSRFKNKLELKKCNKTYFTGRLRRSPEVVIGINLD